jgi:oxepin-CoA hydrolase/3-oxo-5,6-dehydrosuberyl-CoA semialdehyde dehydrogenase
MRLLQSYVAGRWHAAGSGEVLRNAANGEPVAEISSRGVDFAEMLAHARTVGGPNLRKYTFHQRALMLKALAQHLNEHKSAFYASSTATGATRADSWFDIDGGISTLFVYASKGRREMPNSKVYLDGMPESLSREGGFAGQHICVPIAGCAVHINAFNFPVWGMLEKLAPALLAGVPAIVKPASCTAYLTEEVFHRIISADILPPGSIQLICGGTGDLLDRLGCQDLVAFTGSASTAQKLRSRPAILQQAVRFTAETDSLNAAILLPDAVPGSAEFDLYVDEVVKEMTTKAGQKCTAIRRAIVPVSLIAAVVEALQDRLAAVRVGNPALEDVDMGALASLGQRIEVRRNVQSLLKVGQQVYDCSGRAFVDADGERGAFMHPVLIICDDADTDSPVHAVEAFGPVSCVVPYGDLDDAVAIANRGQGSLAASIFTGDPATARTVALGIAPYHGRILVVDRHCGSQSTGHGSPLPHLVHGGPGRAGGGEEMGGIRGVMHYMQRTAVQGSPATITAIGERWVHGAWQLDGSQHPFRKTFDELAIGDTLLTPGREITLEDIERFADLSGDRFYAHMDDAAARANPFFDGRVAHGYFVVSLAAGLFVDPAPGPVLANYGLDDLRFTTPVYPGDILTVRFTCKQKTAREGESYGEVRWDTEIFNQKQESVASYDVLTLVARS